MKGYHVTLFVGAFNFTHGAFHIIQFLQSVLLGYYSLSHQENSTLSKIMESPWMALIFGIIGIVTLWQGWKDYKHHKFHKD
jgi:hypothetical protein